MSYAESHVYLHHAEQALARGQYLPAAGRYAEVVVGLQPQANATRPLAPEALPLVRQYVAACQGWTIALTRLEHLSPAEQVLLAVLGKLRRFISNLGTSVACRAQLLTDYKQCFYLLAAFYTSHGLPERLEAFVQQHAADLQRWRRDLNLQNMAQQLN